MVVFGSVRQVDGLTPPLLDDSRPPEVPTVSNDATNLLDLPEDLLSHIVS